MCHGFGAASFIPCDRCGGLGKRSHHTPLGNVGAAPASISCGCNHCQTDTATESAGCGDGRSNNSSSRSSDSSRSECLDGEGTRIKGCIADGGKDEGAAPGRLTLTRTADCAKCSGSGKVPAPREGGGRSYCTHCAGARFVEESAELSLSIPPGVEMGHTEVYRGKGHVEMAGALPL